MKDEFSYCFEQEFIVRDYELDRFDVVNNAVYQNYLEHTRHTFIQSIGIDLTELRKKGFNPVVSRAEIEYKTPLRSGDRFIVKLGVAELRRVKFVFVQGIYKLPEMSLTTLARITGTVLGPLGRPELPSAFRDHLIQYLPS